MRPIGHQPANLAKVPRRGEATRNHHEHPFGDALHLLQDVRREEDHPAGVRELPEEGHHVEALARVHPVEGLVEHEDGRVVDERGRHLGALPHALGVRGQLAVRGHRELDPFECPVHGTAPERQALELGTEADELAGREIREDRLALGDEPHAPVDCRVAEGRAPVHGDAAR